MKNLFRRSCQGAALGLVCATVIAAFFLCDFLETVELKLLDARIRHACLSSGRDQPDEVVIVTIDQNSLEEVRQRMDYSWPWPRQFYGKMIEFLTASGARAILFDMFFTEPDIDRRDIPGKISDAAFEEATRASGSVHHGGVLREAGLPPPEDKTAAFLEKTRPMRISEITPHSLAQFQTAALPSPGLVAGGRMPGFLNILPERDNIIRRIPLLAFFGAHRIPSLALAAAWESRQQPDVILGRNYLSLGHLSVPTDERSRMFLKWYPIRDSTDSSFVRYSAAGVLRSAIRAEMGRPPEIPAESFAGRTVIIGSSAPGLFDLKATPLSDAVPGAEIQATALTNLLRGEFLSRTTPAHTLTLLFALCLLIGVLTRGGKHVAVGLGAMTIVSLTILFLGYRLLEKKDLFMDMAPGLAGVWLTFVAGTILNYISERRHSALVRGIFEHYLDRSIVKTLISHPDRVRLGGEKRNCTVLFSDVANFTSTSEQLSPEQVVQFMNIYLNAMTEIILAEGGFVDKFVGDEIVAIFGAPQDLPNHAVRACRTILRMRRRQQELQPEFRAVGCTAEVFSRTGLSTGNMVVGNMGSEKRMNYTAMGDVMNLGARIEGINKVYGTRVLVSENTAAAASSQFVFREMDLIQVKGKAAGARILELVGGRNELSAGEIEILSLFEKGLQHYRAQRWAEALAMFEKAAVKNDPPSSVFADRCREFLALPPPAEWDGVYVMRTK